ncbi:response regulator [Pedobacter sp. LMG 31464]|uniref:Response regulator n=1 Tax=Pedobacter planticolens TaxID=2679964 RepID=A0A923E0Z5_9SPHI|nr:response regulator transcription factor [Pedobacter planticolens]MBB2146255.1 response regulator [Pedobacter planticolens]
MNKNIRIVIIEDDSVLRMAYKSLLSDVDDYSVVNTYASFDEAKKELINDNPDITLLDIEMPGTTGLEAIPIIKKILPQTHVIILTVFDSEEKVFNALINGASGFLTKNSSSIKIIESIHEVAQGGGAMSMNIARVVMRSFQKNLDSPLTKRETEILDLIAEGQTKTQVADQLFIDLETVRSHVKNIYIKLDVNSKSDAIKIAKTKKFI